MYVFQACPVFLALWSLPSFFCFFRIQRHLLFLVFTLILNLFSASFVFIHSFIHSSIYIAPLKRKLLRGAPDSNTVKNVFKCKTYSNVSSFLHFSFLQ